MENRTAKGNGYSKNTKSKIENKIIHKIKTPHFLNDQIDTTTNINKNTTNSLHLLKYIDLQNPLKTQISK